VVPDVGLQVTVLDPAPKHLSLHPRLDAAIFDFGESFRLQFDRERTACGWRLGSGLAIGSLWLSLLGRGCLSWLLLPPPPCFLEISFPGFHTPARRSLLQRLRAWALWDGLTRRGRFVSRLRALRHFVTLTPELVKELLQHWRWPFAAGGAPFAASGAPFAASGAPWRAGSLEEGVVQRPYDASPDENHHDQDAEEVVEVEIIEGVVHLI